MRKNVVTWRDAAALTASLACLAVGAAVLRALPRVTEPTVAMTFLLVVLGTGAVARFWVAAITSLAAMLAFNFLFIPPVGTFRIADPLNWVALVAFLAVALVASQVSSASQA